MGCQSDKTADNQKTAFLTRLKDGSGVFYFKPKSNQSDTNSKTDNTINAIGFW